MIGISKEFPAGTECAGALAKQNKLMRMQAVPPAAGVVLTPSAIPGSARLQSADFEKVSLGWTSVKDKQRNAMLHGNFPF